MCALGPHAFYAVASDRTSPILHLCAHLDPICLMWPSHFIGGSLTPRNQHVCTRAPCLLCNCAWPHEFHIAYMCTSRPYQSKVALLFRWRIIHYTKSPCVHYSPVYAVRRVPRTPCYVTLLVHLLSIHDCQMRIAIPYCSFSLES